MGQLKQVTSIAKRGTTFSKLSGVVHMTDNWGAFSVFVVLWRAAIDVRNPMCSLS